MPRARTVTVLMLICLLSHALMIMAIALCLCVELLTLPLGISLVHMLTALCAALICSVMLMATAASIVPDARGWQLHRDICDHINTRFTIKADADGNRYGEEAKSFLGCQIVHDWSAHTVTVTLPAKTRAVLDMANMTDCNSKRTPGHLASTTA